MSHAHQRMTSRHLAQMGSWMTCMRQTPSLTQPVSCWAFELSQRDTTEVSISVMLSWFNRKILLAGFRFCIHLRWESGPLHERILNFIFEHFFFWSAFTATLTLSQPYARSVASTLLSLLESIQLSFVAVLQSCFYLNGFHWTKSQVLVCLQRHKEGESMREWSGEDQILTCLPLQ